jgi:sec-independent protein translocase protein TatC
MIRKWLNVRSNTKTDANGEIVGGEMSLLEHLDELRVRLVRCAIAIAVFFVLGFYFSDKIYNFIQQPVLKALTQAQSLQVATAATPVNVQSLQEGDPVQYTFRVESTLGDVAVPSGVTVPGLVKKAGEKLVVVTAQKWVVGNAVIPAGTELPIQLEANDPRERLIIDTVTGAFSLYVRVAFYAAFIFSMPFLLFQIWGFVSPGLYRHEKRYVWPFISMGTIFFLMGAAFGYYIAFPRAALWLLQLGSGFRPLLKADDYFDLITIIMFGLGLVFQIPTVTFFLARIGLVTPGSMARPWRYAIVAIFIVAAVISPTGDIPNLLVFAVPMMTLYALSIGIAWIFGKPRQTDEEFDKAS